MVYSLCWQYYMWYYAYYSKSVSIFLLFCDFHIVLLYCIAMQPAIAIYLSIIIIILSYLIIIIILLLLLLLLLHLNDCQIVFAD